MAKITKYNVYLNENQNSKLNMLAATTGRAPEELVNNAVYSYLAIVNPFAEDKEPPESVHEILFEIPEETAKKIMNTLHLEDYDDLDEYAKALLLRHSFSYQR